MALVSIRTRPFGRVMQRSSTASRQRSPCFNPHPAFRPGDARGADCFLELADVSIRTRPFGRVMRVDAPASREALRWVSIRTRPFGRVMPTRRDRPRGAAGVSIRTRPFGRVMQLDSNVWYSSDNVSIRTRPFGRVMRNCVDDGTLSITFQSAPGLSAG